MDCPNCRGDVPADAAYCIHCAAALTAAHTEEKRPATGPTVRLDTLPPPAVPRPPTVPSAPAPRGRRHRQHQRHGRRNHANPGAGIFLVGLGILVLTGLSWPRFLILLGVAHLAKESGRRGGLWISRGALFFLGLAFLVWAHLVWPGILFLLGLMLFLKPHKRGWGWC